MKKNAWFWVAVSATVIVGASLAECYVASERAGRGRGGDLGAAFLAIAMMILAFVSACVAVAGFVISSRARPSTPSRGFEPVIKRPPDA
jgi:hypothetical protein